MTQDARSSAELEQAVNDRYGKAAQAREAELCCPVEYRSEYLEVIPDEVLARDYGCGDPSRYVREGDTVLDLGSGGGKICFIAAQLVGPKGRVIGVDTNPEMLALARSAAPTVAERIGYDNTHFLRGRIQDLGLNLDRVDALLADEPPRSAEALKQLQDRIDHLRQEHPLVENESVDIVVSNCVLNLVRDEDKRQLIGEIFRVLRRGGRIAISDIVSDEPVPANLRRDPELWSGCVSGAFEEQQLLAELERAGFHGIQINHWEHEPFRTVNGIEFRSVTVTASKGKQGACWEANQAVVYRGPWKRVEDDDGHVYERGERTAVCAKTFALLDRDPYAGQFVPIEPRHTIPENERKPFDCSRASLRHARESKGLDYHFTSEAPSQACCAPGSGCEDA